MIEKWEYRRDLVLSHLCLVGRMESGEMEILFVWLRRKIRKWKIKSYKFTIMSLLN